MEHGQERELVQVLELELELKQELEHGQERELILVEVLELELD